MSGQEAREPLLPRQTAAHRLSQRQPGQLRHTATTTRTNKQDEASHSLGSVDLGSRFLGRLYRIACIIHAAPALILVLVSLAETVIVSKIGTISGLFYQVFVDGQSSRVPHLMVWSAGCYTATALFYALKAGLQDYLAWRWRAALTLRLQQLYCRQVGATCPKSREPLLQSLDSPDQRVAQDLPLLTASLSEVVKQLAAVPFNIAWYTHLTHQIFGSWLPVGVAWLFFLCGGVLQRLVMLPVASAVFQQEAAEGGFRYAHTRFRAWASEIALYRSEPIEQQHLEGQLCRVLVCQGRLLLRRAVLTATSRLLEYGGLVVNFGCLAVAVFSGAWSGAGQSAGDIASKVSVASFYLLTLIYNFTQVLDLASKVANLAGLTARVGQMLEVLAEPGTACDDSGNDMHAAPSEHPQHHDTQGPQRGQQQRSTGTTYSRKGSGVAAQHLLVVDPPESPHFHQQQPLQEVVAGKSPSHQRYASQAVLLQPPQLVLLQPTNSTTGHQHTHSCGSSASARDSSGQQPGDSLDSQQQQQLLHGPFQLGAPAQQQPQQQAAVPGAGTNWGHPSHELMQVSIHSMGADMLLQEVRRAFPDSPRLAPLLAVVTFQFCGAAKARMLSKLQQQLAASRPAGQPRSSRVAAGSTDLAVVAAAAATGAGGGDCCRGCATGSPAGCDGAAGGPMLCADSDMQHALGVFIAWQQVVHTYITSRGYWCDTIDPRSGTALHSTAGSHYDEVIGASVLLGYERVTPPGQAFSLITHPEAATQVYPATLFTSAPLPVLRDALRAAADPACSQTGTAGAAAADGFPTDAPPSTAGWGALPCPIRSDVQAVQVATTTPATTRSQEQAAAALAYSSSSSSSSSGSRRSLSKDQGPSEQQQQLLPQQQQQLLRCSLLSVWTPSGVHIVQDLELEVLTGRCVLIQGPSGCGKSTLISCLAGLWPADAGSISLLTAAGSPATIDHATGAESRNVCSWGAAGAPAIPGQAVGCEQQHNAGAAAEEVIALKPPSQAVAGCRAPGVHARVTRTMSPAGGVMFVPQRPLAAPGATLRQQLEYPAAANMWPCSCHRASSSGGSSSGGDRTQKACQPRQLRSHWRMRAVKQQAAGVDWWRQWLSCGLHHQQLQRSVPCTAADWQHQAVPPAQWQQQQQPLLVHQQVPCPTCQHMVSVLDAVGLSYLVAALPHGLHTHCDDWGDVLSPGELQRLSFARVLLLRPALVVLDEATSSLPDAAAVQLYRQLQAAGCSYVSVGHSTCLTGVHQVLLSMTGDGTGAWQLKTLQAQ